MYLIFENRWKTDPRNSRKLDPRKMSCHAVFCFFDVYLYRRLPSDRWNWSDESGVYERTREGYSLPSSQWQWADGQWTVETKPNITDKDGWQYAVDFPRFEFLHLN